MSEVANRTVNVYFNTDSAEKALEGLNARGAKLKETIEKGEKAGKDMSKAVEQLSGTKSKIKELEGIISGKLAPTFTMTKARANELRRELERMSADAPGYAQKFDQFKKVSERLREMQSEVKGVSSAMGSAGKSSFWENVKGYAVGQLAADAVRNLANAGWEKIKEYIRDMPALADSLADVRKAAGLTEEQAKKLNGELAAIKTRTPTKELREIAVGLGQIGEAATAANVEAIDKIVVALGDEFGGGAKEITTQLGVLRNNLADIKSGNYGADVMHIGNALNVLGAEGLATAPVIVDYANRMAGIAGTFKVTSGQILGLAAAMQETGVEVERGSTAITKLFQKIAAEPGKFAKVAGMDIKAFSNLINTDMLGAFNAVAVGANKASANNTVFAKILKDLDADGSGAGEVISKLAKNQELLQAKTKLASDALKSQASITEEFNIKNNNYAATLSKIGKWFEQKWMTSGLPEFITAAVTGFAKLIGAIDRSEESLAKFHEQQQKVNRLQSDIVPLLARYDELKAKTALSKDEQIEMNKAIGTIAETIPAAITQFDKYGKAIGVSTEKARDFIENQILMQKELNREAIEASKKTIKSLEKEMSTYQSVEEAKERISRKIADMQKKREDPATSPAMSKRYAGMIDEESAILSKHIAKMQQLSDRIRGQRAIIEDLDGTALKKRLDETETNKPKAAGGATITDYMTDEEAKKLQALLEKRQAFFRKINALRAESEAASVSADEKEIARVKAKYDELEHEAQELLAHTKQMGQAMSILSESEQAELGALYKKQFEQRSEREYADTVKKVSAHFDLERKAANEAFTQGELSAKAHSNRMLSIDEDEAKAKAVVASDYVATVKQAVNDLANFEERASIKAVEDERRKRQALVNERLASADLAVTVSPRGSEAELTAQKARLQTRFEVETEGMDQTSAMYLSKQAELNVATKDMDAQFISDRVAMFIDFAGKVADFTAQMNEMHLNSMRNQVEAERQAGDKKKQLLAQQLSDKKISQSRYNREINKIEDAQAEREHELRVKEFRADQQAKLVQGGLNLAMGITNIIAHWAANPLMVSLLSAAAIGLNAIQMAAIASAKPPEYALGGLAPNNNGGVPSGPSHKNGGIALIDSRTGTKVGEMEGGEPILSTDTYRNNPELVNALLDTSMNKGGARLQRLYAMGGMLDQSRIMRDMHTRSLFAGGGVTSGRADQVSAAGAAIGFDANTIEVLRTFTEQLSKGVNASVYYNDFDKKNKEISMLKALNTAK